MANNLSTTLLQLHLSKQLHRGASLLHTTAPGPIFIWTLHATALLQLTEAYFTETYLGIV